MSGRGTLYHISSTPWHFTWQSAHKYTRRFVLEGWNVLFIDPLPKRFPHLTEYKRVIGRIRGNAIQSGKMRQLMVEGVEYIVPRTLPDRGAVLRSLNRKWFLPALANTLLTMTTSEPRVALVTLPTRAALDLVDLLRPDILIYMCYLNFAKDTQAPSDICDTERELTQRADLVLVDQGLDNRERILSYSPSSPVIHISASVDYSHFAIARNQEASYKQGDGKPRCCYFGDLRYVDTDLLKQISRLYPLRLIGPRSVSAHTFSPQTELFPAVTHDQLPLLLRDTDILLLPYRINDPYNRGVFPTKTFECLATGKPTIAMGLPSLEPFSGAIDIAESPDDFLERLAHAAQDVLNPDTPTAMAKREARLEIARQHDEANQASPIFTWLNEALNRQASNS
jgi:hypothetical protein